MPALLVRHAPTALNAEGSSSASDVLRGWSDIALSAVGYVVAEETARALCRLPITAIYSTDLSRGLDTAQALATKLGLVVEPRTELRPWHYGSLTGTPTPDALPMLDYLTSHPLQPAPGGGESFLQFLTRFLPYIMRFARDPALTAHFTHGRDVKAAESHVDAHCQGINMDTWKRAQLIPPGGAILLDGMRYRIIHPQSHSEAA